MDGDSVGKCGASPNVRLGAVWGYGFPLGHKVKLGPGCRVSLQHYKKG